MKPEMQDIHSCWPLKFASEPLKVEEGNAFPACFPKAFMRKIFKELLNSTFNCKFVNLNDMIRKTLVLLMLGCSLSVHAQTNFDNYDSSRGFRHPGGLHTQADFNRIKQQLADGNAAVTASYNILKNAAYALPNAGTNPVETIVRGGGSGENYMHAARGATIAYQNALRWKIEGNTACADHAVEVLMRWANTTKYISGRMEPHRLQTVPAMDAGCVVSGNSGFPAWKKRHMGKFGQMVAGTGTLLVELGALQCLGLHQYRSALRRCVYL